MNKTVKLPITKKIKETRTIDGIEQEVESTIIEYQEIPLIEQNTQDSIFIKSLPYLPDFLQDKQVMKEASILLDALLQSKEAIEKEINLIQASRPDADLPPVDWSVMDEIYSAYCDTLYKLPGYNNLSYGAKISLLKENGFDYVLDLLLHMYDSDYANLEEQYEKDPNKTPIPTYEEYVKTRSDAYLTRLTMLFSLIKILKGKTAGLELVFDIIDIPEFLYLTWDIIANYKGEWDGSQPLPMPGGDIDVQKGDVYDVVTDSSNTTYIFNGVKWHICTDWQPYTTPRERFTAELSIYGESSTELQAKIATFVRHYMLPYIDVTLHFDHDMPRVYAFCSGNAQLFSTLILSNYIDESGNVVHKNLQHIVSDECWRYADPFALGDLLVGKPTHYGNGFLGTVNLNRSYVLTNTGDIHYLYGETPVIPEVITGPARDNYTPEGTIVDYNGEYLQAQLLRGYIDIDITTGVQNNPTYELDEYGEYSILERDTIVKFFTLLTVDAIHHAKLVEEMEQILIEDFEKELTGAEVFAGRTTFVDVWNTNGKMQFETRIPETRPKVDNTEEYVLKFTNGFVHNDGYTGIGDLGILGANSYFIYNGMLFWINNGTYNQVGEETTWSDVGATHAVSELYYTPAIYSGKLMALKDGVIEPIVRDPNENDVYKDFVINYMDKTVDDVDSMLVEDLNTLQLYKFRWYQDTSYWDERETNNWQTVTGYMDQDYTCFGICDGYLYKIYLNPLYTETNAQPRLVFCQLDSEQGWTYITGVSYLETYEAYGIKNQKLYRITSEGITEVTLDGQEIVGWDGSFECVGRYHHTNPVYMTYGVCNGNLYGLKADSVQLLDEGGWQRICGFYNDESPRTYAYGIKNNHLYELVGDQVNLKDDTRFWVDISGCTTTTNTFVIGIAKDNETDETGYIYRINKTTLSKLYEEDGWTDVFGRYTTSTSKSANCYGYATKNNKLYILNKDFTTPLCVSGMWKLNGEGPGVDLLDYDITQIALQTDNGLVVGKDAILDIIPLNADDPESNYDIYVHYDTLGFDDNTRYNVRAEIVHTDWTYIDPTSEESNRYDIWLDHAPTPFNTTTGVYDNFIKCPVIIHGNRNINGAGEAYDFVREQTYLELPQLGYYNVQFEYAHKTYGPFRFDKTPHNIEFLTTNDFFTPTAYEPPRQYDNMIIRDLNLWESNYCREIDYLLTVRDEYQINVSVSEVPDEITHIGIRMGCICNSTDSLYGAILDENGDTGIYYGCYNNNTGLFVKFGGNNSGYSQIYTIPDGTNADPYLRFDKVQYGWNVYLSIDNNTYTRVFSSNAEVNIQQPKYLGGYNGNYADCIFYLAESYVQGTETLKLYDNGYYVSVGTTQRDYIQRIITDENQESQKVIEILDSEGNLLDDFEMDRLYESRTSELVKGDLQVVDNFTINELHDDGQVEGTSYATLTYGGAFTLDPEKAIAVGDLELNSGYNLTSIASNFTNTDYLMINPENMNEVPLIITTGDNVVSQYLFDSEEDSVFINKPLLTAEVSGEYVGSPHEIHFVPSGIETELITDTAGTVTKQLVYNAESFEIDTTKLIENRLATFDSYTGTITQFSIDGQYYNDEDDIRQFTPYYDSYITLNLDLENGTLLDDGSTDTLPFLNFTPGDNYKKKTIQYDQTSIEMGNLYQHWVPDEEQDPDAEEESGTYEDVEEPDPIYEYEANTPYWIKWNIKREEVGLVESLVTEYNTQTDPKDRFFYKDGTVRNFSCHNYFDIKQLNSHKGLVICLTTNDDPSIDQGILEAEGIGALCIKDSRLCWVTPDGMIMQSMQYMNDNQTYYIALRNENEDGELQNLTQANIYISGQIGGSWDYVFAEDFSFNVPDIMRLGYTEAGSGKLPFNGTVDLTNSYEIDADDVEQRLFTYQQTGKLFISPEKDGQYTLLQEIVTPYAVYNYNFGYQFVGSVDLYASDLLLPYTLEWLDVETRISINQQIRNDLQEADPEYNPDLDTNVYTIEEYGVHLEDIPPERWDEIHITYVTTDHAYYAQPNTQYYLKCLVDVDTESGKSLLTHEGNASWNNGVISNLQNTDEYSLQFTDEQYVVIQFTTGQNITSKQAVCGYMQDGSQAIVINEGTINHYADGVYTNLGLQIKPNRPYFLKLYCTQQNIEYSEDGKNWTQSNVSALFSNYVPFTFGNGYTDEGRLAFRGSIDLKQCYTFNGSTNYIYKPYKRIMPMISTNNVDYEPLALVPLLTINDYISFGKGFDGTLDLYNSQLLLPDATYWTANQIDVYDMNDVLWNTFIRDDIPVDPTHYWKDSHVVKVDPDELKLQITGFPLIGDQIILTYDCYYLFREDQTEYEFKMDYEGDWCYISYNKLGDEKSYLLWTIPADDHIVNTGFQLNGTFSMKDSTRGGMTLCEYLEWYTYEVNYKKSTEDTWTNWTSFTVERKLAVFERCGYELKGTHYLETSYLKMDDLFTPFLSYYNNNYIVPMGAVYIDDGIASSYSEDDWLQFKPEALQDGYMINMLYTTSNDVRNQGISTNLVINNGILCTPTDLSTSLHKAKPNYTYCVQYFIKDGMVTMRVIGRNVSNFTPRRSPKHVITLIPTYGNEEFVTTQEEADSIHVYYRKVSAFDTYDTFTHKGDVHWYQNELIFKNSITYMGDTYENIYAAQIPFGYEEDMVTNANPQRLPYYMSEIIQFKLVCGDEQDPTFISYYNICPYNDLVFQQKVLK